MRVPKVVKDFAAPFREAGFQCYLVGGAVRDTLMGRAHTDYDIATDALPEQVTSLFRRVIPTGIKHGTVTVLFKDITFEVTTFRTEAGTAMVGGLTASRSRQPFSTIFRAGTSPSTRLPATCVRTRSSTRTAAARTSRPASSGPSETPQNASTRMGFGRCARAGSPRSFPS